MRKLPLVCGSVENVPVVRGEWGQNPLSMVAVSRMSLLSQGSGDKIPSAWCECRECPRCPRGVGTKSPLRDASVENVPVVSGEWG
jgi:hypothetical protein